MSTVSPRAKGSKSVCRTDRQHRPRMLRSRCGRVILAALLLGTLTLTTGCGDRVSSAVKNGVFTWVSGSVGNTLNANVFGDLITSFFAGNLGGGGGSK